MNVLNQSIHDQFALYQGDCVEVLGGMKDSSIHYALFSPPFASLYTYSNSDRDMGNSRGGAEFLDHFAFLVKDLYRVLIPGRLVSIHCMNIPSMKSRDGVIGLKDFRGDIIRVFTGAGFIFHSEVCIWKDPLVEATRTKALGLMHKQLVKDSAMCRNGLPDYLITMRKPGDNPQPISHPNGLTEFAGEDEPLAPKTESTLKSQYTQQNKHSHISSEDPVYSHHVWRRYASPVWMDIRQSNTLQRTSARAEKDEKHICPLQLDVIERALTLWTNPGDIVLDPFAGIGSVPYQALSMRRRGVGIELKDTYFGQAVKNCEAAVDLAAAKTDFDRVTTETEDEELTSLDQ